MPILGDGTVTDGNGNLVATGWQRLMFTRFGGALANFDNSAAQIF
jgi:hypothetical protein